MARTVFCVTVRYQLQTDPRIMAKLVHYDNCQSACLLCGGGGGLGEGGREEGT